LENRETATPSMSRMIRIRDKLVSKSQVNRNEKGITSSDKEYFGRIIDEIGLKGGISAT
jgi:hypothetical protein